MADLSRLPRVFLRFSSDFPMEKTSLFLGNFLLSRRHEWTGSVHAKLHQCHLRMLLQRNSIQQKPRQPTVCVVDMVMQSEQTHIPWKRIANIQLSLCIYIYIHMCTHIHTYIHAYIHTYIHTCIHACMHAYMHTCIHAYMHTCIHAYMHTCIHAYMHTCIHGYMDTWIHAYMHTCIHAYMHTCIHGYMDTWIHAYMHTCIHAYIHTCIHTYIYSYYTCMIDSTMEWHVLSSKLEMATVSPSCYPRSFPYKTSQEGWLPIQKTFTSADSTNVFPCFPIYSGGSNHQFFRSGQQPNLLGLSGLWVQISLLGSSVEPPGNFRSHRSQDTKYKWEIWNCHVYHACLPEDATTSIPLADD